MKKLTFTTNSYYPVLIKRLDKAVIDYINDFSYGRQNEETYNKIYSSVTKLLSYLEANNIKGKNIHDKIFAYCTIVRNYSVVEAYNQNMKIDEGKATSFESTIDKLKLMERYLALQKEILKMFEEKVSA